MSATPHASITPSSKVVEASSDSTAAEKGHAVGKNSAWLTAGIIVADVVGAGILGMPVAVAKFGWLLGAAVMAALLAANVHIAILLWRVRMQCPGAHTYVELASASFAGAPPWQRRAATVVTSTSQLSFIFGMLGLYLLSAGKGFGMALFQYHVCLPQWALMGCVVLLPFALTAREMGSYKSLVWINILTLCGTVLIPLALYTVSDMDEIRPADSEVYAFSSLTAAGVLSGLSTFTFGMTSQFMLTEIISEMKDPAEMPKAYAYISAPFQLVAFMVAGLGGYMFIGDQVTGMIDENMPFGSPFRAAAVCMVVHMLISYLIKGVVFTRAVQRACDKEHVSADDPSLRARVSWAVAAALVLVLSWFLANLVPFFGDAVDLLGASFTPLSSWVIPIVMFARHYKDSEKDRPYVSALEWAVMVVELALAFALMVLGTYSSINNIVSHWHTYGYPFDCHCEGLWDTCECSAEHVGMQGQCDVVGGL